MDITGKDGEKRKGMSVILVGYKVLLALFNQEIIFPPHEIKIIYWNYNKNLHDSANENVLEVIMSRVINSGVNSLAVTFNNYLMGKENEILSQSMIRN